MYICMYVDEVMLECHDDNASIKYVCMYICMYVDGMILNCHDDGDASRNVCMHVCTCMWAK